MQSAKISAPFWAVRQGADCVYRRWGPHIRVSEGAVGGSA
jgi:predicted DNA-binding WGR domain protein